MSKIRRFEIASSEGKYFIRVGTEHSIMEIDQDNDEVVSTIMEQINSNFNLTEEEINEYTQTLKYILE